MFWLPEQLQITTTLNTFTNFEHLYALYSSYKVTIKDDKIYTYSFVQFIYLCSLFYKSMITTHQFTCASICFTESLTFAYWPNILCQVANQPKHLYFTAKHQDDKKEYRDDILPNNVFLTDLWATILHRHGSRPLVGNMPSINYSQKNYNYLWTLTQEKDGISFPFMQCFD